MSILYVTQNGVTDHIGRSQVAPYVIDLAKLGFSIHVLSAEKPGHELLIAQYRKLFDEVGVKWTHVCYRNTPVVVGQARTQAAMKRAAKAIVRREGIKILHCRSFPPALIAYQLKRQLGIKYIFDFRDFYADGGLNKARGLARLIYRYMKHMERPMVRDADKVVCLTYRARTVLSDWYLQDISEPHSRFQVIPCCADFAHFDLSKLSSGDVTSARTKAGLQPGDFVLLYLGSLGPDYLLSEMIALFRQVLLVIPGAYFLFISNNGQELVDAECHAYGIDLDRIRFISADRDEIPAFLALADISVVFIRADVSKAGCSPTKLAELFACNVPVIANTGVGDMDSICDLPRNGSVVVKDFSDETLRSAINQVMAFKKRGFVSIRNNSREFGLDEGVARYAAVYNELLTD